MKNIEDLATALAQIHAMNEERAEILSKIEEANIYLMDIHDCMEMMSRFYLKLSWRDESPGERVYRKGFQQAMSRAQKCAHLALEITAGQDD